MTILKVQTPEQLKTERLQIIDALRGVALFGILITHCSHWFSAAKLPESFYHIHAAGSVDALLVNKVALLFENKFYTLFSFLFGLSFTLILSRSFGSPVVFRKIFVRRMFILGIIGLLHYLHWRGDILLVYAVLGWLLLLFNQASNKTILVMAALLVLDMPNKMIHLSLPERIERKRHAEIALSAQNETANFHLLLDGSYRDTILDNVNHIGDTIGFQFGSGRIYKTLGFFLVGLYAGRRRVFHRLKGDRSRWWNYTIYCMLAFLGTKAAIIIFNQLYDDEQQRSSLIQSLYQLVYDLGSALQTLFYIGSLTLFFQSRTGQRTMPVFGAVGKMSLTNYLLQTLIGSWLFFGYGLGLLGVVELWEAILISLPIFLFQIVFSTYWMKHFRYGPVEWMWRTLTYSKVQTTRA